MLYQHPSVMEVAVVGVADDYWSQLVTAFVVPRPGKSLEIDELRTFCKEQLAAYKVPKNVQIVDALPKDTQGKILKRELRRNADTSAQPPA